MPLPRASVRTSSYFADRVSGGAPPAERDSHSSNGTREESHFALQRRPSEPVTAKFSDEDEGHFSLKEALERSARDRGRNATVGQASSSDVGDTMPFGRKSIHTTGPPPVHGVRPRGVLGQSLGSGITTSNSGNGRHSSSGELSSRSRMPSSAVLPPPPPVPLPHMSINANFNPYRPTQTEGTGPNGRSPRGGDATVYNTSGGSGGADNTGPAPELPAQSVAAAAAESTAPAQPPPANSTANQYQSHFQSIPANQQPRVSIFDFRMDSDSESQNATVPGLPAKTGTGMPVLGHHPVLCQEEAVPREEPQYLCFSNNHLAAEMMSHDAERMAHPLDVKNRVVYDSLDAPPPCQQSAPPSTSAASAAAAAAAVGPPAPSRPAPPAPGGGGNSEASIPLNGGADPLGFNANPGTYQDGMLPPPYYQLEGEDDTTLVFESRFESGNLRRAIQVYDNEYDLILRPDINTRGHTQWFYFSVSNTRVKQSYKLNIINMVKSDSLYQWGMQPLICSEKDAIARGTGWVRVGSNISYYQNNIKRKNGHYYYTFTCTLTFPHDNDTVYVAYCYPYTYTDLQRYLRKLEEDPKRRQRFRRRVLCQTLAGNNCDLLTITSFGGDPESLRHRRGVVITGRVHPGESNASWMMRGALDFLTGPSLDAKILRDNFVFKVVPMLNPDGVINGNYRCSLAGVDLNRVWNDPSKKLHPTIFHTKAMIKRLMEDREVVMFCDFHGHSRKKNVFMYGCEKKVKQRSVFDDNRNKNDSQANMIGSTVVGNRLLERVFPCALWHSSPDIFAFSDCNFKVQKAKETTARVVLWREFNLVNSFTLEASFAGPSVGREAGTHFTTLHLQQIGASFCDTLLDYCDPDPTRMQGVLRELEMLFPPKQHHGLDSYRPPVLITQEPPAPTTTATVHHNNNHSNGRDSGGAGPPSDEEEEDSDEGVVEGEDVEMLSDSDDSDSDSDGGGRKRRLKKKGGGGSKKKGGGESKTTGRGKLVSVSGSAPAPKDGRDHGSGRDRWRGAVAVLSSARGVGGPAKNGRGGRDSTMSKLSKRNSKIHTNENEN